MAITIIKAGSQYFDDAGANLASQALADARIDLISTRLLPCQC